MAEYTTSLQWEMVVSIFHNNRGERVVELGVLGKRGEYHRRHLGSWRGLGCPPDVIEAVVAAVDACLSEHLVTRYGERLTLNWAEGERQRLDP